jgi:hypothetical protein
MTRYASLTRWLINGGFGWFEKMREDVDAAKLILLRQHLLQSTENNILFYVVTFLPT